MPIRTYSSRGEKNRQSSSRRRKSRSRRTTLNGRRVAAKKNVTARYLYQTVDAEWAGVMFAMIQWSLALDLDLDPDAHLHSILDSVAKFHGY